MRGVSRLGAALLLVCASGCLSRAPEPRYFRPESAGLDGALVGASPAEGAVPLRLRSVRGAPFLRERIVWRISPVEYGLYDSRRWSELPASYVGRALLSALLGTPGLRLTDELRAPSLRVEVVAFEEVFRPRHVASVGLVVSLAGSERQRLLDRSFRVDEPIAGEEPAETARAMGRALDRVVGEVAAAVAAATAAGI